jgi:cytochrome c biogenesis protein ResB
MEFLMVIRSSWFLIVLILLMGSFVGCYQRTVAPALIFDQKNAETLDSEIKKMEWD